VTDYVRLLRVNMVLLTWPSWLSCNLTMQLGVVNQKNPLRAWNVLFFI